MEKKKVSIGTAIAQGFVNLVVELGVDYGLSYLTSLGVNYLAGYDAVTTLPVFVAALTVKAFVLAVK